VSSRKNLYHPPGDNVGGDSDEDDDDNADDDNADVGDEDEDGSYSTLRPQNHPSGGLYSLLSSEGGTAVAFFWRF